MDKIKKVVSVDPGTAKAGFAYFENEELVYSEQIELSGKSFYLRLRALKSAIERFLAKYGNTGYVAIETPYIGINPQSGLKVALARGIILAVAFGYQIKIIDISPQEIRSYYGVKGNSKKKAYQDVIKLEFSNIKKKLGEDEADAIAIGATAINKIKQAKLYAKAEKE